MTSALSTAVALVNSGDPLPLAEWATVAVSCQESLRRLGVRGHVVDTEAADSAAGVAQALLGSTQRITPAEQPLAADVLTTTDASHADRVLVALAMATHAARRGNLPAHADTMLAGVEAQALGPRTHSAPAQEALANWPNRLASTQALGPLHQTTAIAVAHVQGEVVRQAGWLLDRAVSAPDSMLDVERLRTQLDRCHSDWRAAREALHKQTPVEATANDARMTRAVSLMAVELRDSLRSQGLVPAHQQLETLIRSGVAGNLHVASVVAAVMRNETVAQNLLSTADQLQRLMTSTVSNSPGSLVTAHEAVAEVTESHVSITEIHVPIEQTARESMSGVHRLAWVKPLLPPTLDGPDTQTRLTPERGAELARRRDAGVVAAAGLAGVPDAVGLVAGTTPQQLSSLVREGRQACGELLAVGLRMASWKFGHKVFRDRDECMAAVAPAIVSAIHTWDPTRSSWTTYAVRVAGWALGKHLRAENTQPIPVLMDVDTDYEQPGFMNPTLLTDPAPKPDEVAAIRIDAAKAAHLVSRLAYPRDAILQRLLGTDGSPPAGASTVAAQFGMPVATVSRHARQGLAHVRSQLGVSPDD